MTAQDVITDFELFMDDTTELSTNEEIRILEKASQLVANQVPWEILKAEYSGTTDGTASLALPARFNKFSENYQYVNSNADYGAGPVVFLGSEYNPYRIISYSDRRRYRDQDGYAYVDIVNSNLVFTKAPASGKAVEYDYTAYPATITAVGDTLWVPDRFKPVLYHAMCVDDFVIQQSEKARSYRDENLSGYNLWLSNMKSWNAGLIQLT